MNRAAIKEQQQIEGRNAHLRAVKPVWPVKNISCLRLVVVLLVLFCGLQTARAQSIAVDNTSSASGGATDVSSLTWSHTVGTGSNRILIVGVSILDGSLTVSTVKYGGTSLTRIGAKSDGGNKSHLEIWKLVAPASGTANIVATPSASTRVVGGAVSFTNVNQITPNGTFASASGSNSTPSVNFTSATGELVIDTVATPGDANSVTVNASQTQRWNRNTGVGSGGEVFGTGSTKAGAATVTMSWTLGSSRNWAIGAVSLKPVPNVTLTKSVSPTSPQPPDTDLAYTINFSNTGSSSASSFVITDAIPANTDFKVGSVTNSLGTTGLTVAVSYSNNSGSTYTYTPASGGGGAPAGYDRSVTNVRWTFTGNLSQTSPNNTGSVSFTARIR